ncbi:MAG: molecular chaperone [Bdellovibrionales bacterium]
MKFIYFLFFTAIIFLVPVQSAFAQLLITPLQVVMEERQRSTTIVLVNTGDRSNTYRLKWEQFVQVDELGGYAPIEEKDKYGVVLSENYRNLKDFAVFTPRQITLAPNEKQTMRVAVRRPADLPDGEYKSHLKFQVLPDNSDGGVRQDNSLEDKVRFGARVNASFSIPVVYRVGEYDVNVEIQQPEFSVNEKSGTLNIKVPVKRSGMHGVIGLIEAYYRPKDGNEVLIGSVSNSNLFPELNVRNITVPTSQFGFNPGNLRLVFFKAEGQRNDYVVMDELNVPVSN